MRIQNQGKILHHSVEENIVTNAVQNVISGALDRLVATHNNTSQAKDIDRLYTLPDTIGKELFGGVMLFSKALTEDKTHVLPTGDEIASLVGYASYIEGVIEGSTTKGTYNAEESTFTDGEMKLVFDFDNAVANGDIASICLTSALGGKYGLKNNTAPGTVLPTQLLSLRIGDPFDHVRCILSTQCILRHQSLMLLKTLINCMLMVIHCIILRQVSCIS